MQFTRNGEIGLHYQVFGGPEGAPAIVFSNSLGTDFRIWRDVVVALAGKYTLVTYDKRGHGLSDAGSPPYTNAELVSDLKQVMDAAGVEAAVICGLSVGGQIALGFAATYPDRVKALILSDTAHRLGDAALWNQRIAQAEASGIASMSGAILERWFSKAFRAPENVFLAGYRNMLERQSIAGYCGVCASLRDADLTRQAQQVGVPTLCVVGDEDASTPPDVVKGLADLIKGARFEIVEGAGHLPCVEKPQEFAQLVQSFLKEAGIGVVA